MEIFGLYDITLFRDEKTGYTCFTMVVDDNSIPRNSYGNMNCIGMIPLYEKNTPLCVSGEFKTNGSQKYLKITDYRTVSKSKSDVICFLSGGIVAGLGPRLAEKIADIAGTDIFEFCKKEDSISKLLEIPKIDKKIPEKLVSKLSNLSSLSSFVKYIISFGGTYNNAIDLYDKYGSSTEDMLRNNPYTMRYAGVSLETIESIAKSENIKPFDRRRTVAITDIILSSNENNGNSRISFIELCQKFHHLDKRYYDDYETPTLYIAEAIILLKCIDVFEDNVLYIYKRETYENEMLIAKELKRLAESAFAMDDKGITLNDIMDECGIYYGASQAKAFDMLITTGVKLLIGGPGVGKTTTINGILKKYKRMYPEKKIAMCAPTGCAAKKMTQSTGQQALTIYKYLDIRPFEESMKCKDSYDQLDADCIVVDEMSMVDETIFALLLRAIKNGTLLILVGDEAQLESVGTGSVLRDLIRSKQIETYYLDTVFRQKNGSKIINNSQKIKDGDIRLQTDDTFKIFHCKDDDEITSILLNQLNNYKEAKVITTSRNRKFKTGSVVLNGKIQEKFHVENGDTVFFNGYRFSVGDKIIMTKTNYEKFFFNGDEGYITGIHVNGYRKEIVVNIDENLITLSGTLLDSIELNYAITAYKAQGNEYDTVIIVLPNNPKILLQRSLLYVAVTRAKKQVLIIEENGALSTAIKNKNKKERNTGLCTKLCA